MGQVLDGRYLIEAVLGEGSMGLVYLCRHTVLDKQVALKVLHRELAYDADAADRFRREAKAASAIGNEHIIEALDFGTLADGSTYMVMEYLEGETLAQRLKKQPLLPFAMVLDLAIQVCEGLSAAHAAGVVHRDLKPDNLFLIERGNKLFVKILDFGIAKIATTQSKLTRAGMVFGTPHYMSPEQAAAQATDERADIYTLGVILYELAVGHVPFDAENAITVLAQHINEEPVPPSYRVLTGRELPRGLDGVILKCLQKSPEERYQKVSGLLDDLRSIEQGIDPGATGKFAKLKAWSIRVAKPRGAARWPYVVGLLLGLLGLGAAAFAWIERARSMPTLPVQETPAVAALPSASPPPTNAAPNADAGTEKPGKRVDFILFPLDARLYHGKKDLGPMPVSVVVPEGEKMTLFVRRPGYWPRRVRVDGSKNRIVIGLRAYNQPKAAEPANSEESVEEAQERESGENAGSTQSTNASQAPNLTTKPENGAQSSAAAPKSGDAPPPATTALPLPKPSVPELPPPER